MARRFVSLLLAVGLLMLGAAFAQTLRIGAVAAATGSAAALGEPEANTFRMMQDYFDEMGGIGAEESQQRVTGTFGIGADVYMGGKPLGEPDQCVVRAV